MDLYRDAEIIPVERNGWPRVSGGMPWDDVTIIPLSLVLAPGYSDQFHLVRWDGWWSLREGSWWLSPIKPPRFVKVDDAELWGRDLTRGQAIEAAKAALLATEAAQAATNSQPKSEEDA